jgi:NADPH:quinone reductase-like Zn-dependent oxidoreductase
MKAAQLVSGGVRPTFVVNTVPDPKPAAGEVQVALEAASLNHRDVWLWEQSELPLPATLGSDGAGVVSAVGTGVSELQVGDAVVLNPALGWGDEEEFGGEKFEILGVPRPGTFAELVVVPAENVCLKPSRLSWVEAATLGVAAVTAWRAVMHTQAAHRGGRIFVPGAGGGVAAFAIQIGTALGAELVTTSSTAEKLEQARRLGARATISYAEGDWTAAAGAVCEGGFDAVIDGVGPTIWRELVDLLRAGGTLVTYGLSGGASAEFASFPLLWQWRKVVGTTMGSPRDFARLLTHVERADWHPAIDSVWPLQELPEAAMRLGSRERFGKVVLVTRSGTSAHGRG